MIKFKITDDICGNEKLELEKMLDRGKVEVVGYEIIYSTCFIDAEDIKVFTEEMLLKSERKPDNIQYNPYKSSIVAYWSLQEPIKIYDEEKLKEVYSKIFHNKNRSNSKFIEPFRFHVIVRYLTSNKIYKKIRLSEQLPILKLGPLQNIKVQGIIKEVDGFSLETNDSVIKELIFKKIVKIFESIENKPHGFNYQIKDNCVLLEWVESDPLSPFYEIIEDYYYQKYIVG